MVMKRFENVNKITVAITGYRARNAGMSAWFPERPPPKRRSALLGHPSRGFRKGQQVI
jgi:hypothetical protein